MEPILGLPETSVDVVDGTVDQSCGYKLVPWLNWEEWDSVRESLFSSLPHSVSSALQRIRAWRSKGCLPVVIEVTASIIEIQQKDAQFGVDIGNAASESEEMLAMLYCMAIMRLVNGVIEKTRKKEDVSIAEAADAINIPRMLIDIRHEGSHRDLPSLRLVRLASMKAIDWLKSYYWEPQKKAIPFQSDRRAGLSKEIKSRLCELAFFMKFKKADSPSVSRGKGKRANKQITKVLKHLVRLYSHYSSDVVSVLVELMLKESNFSDFIELPKNNQVSHDTNQMQSVFDDWKPVIAKLSRKEPGFLLTLSTAVIEMIKTRESMKNGSGEHAILENAAEVGHIEQLSNMFEWLVRNLKGLKLIGGKCPATVTEHSSTDVNLPTSTLLQLLRRSLLVSWPGNNQLKCSALVLARMIGNGFLIEKLNKLCSLGASHLAIDDEDSFAICSDSIISCQEESIREAAKKLELLKSQRRKSNIGKRKDGDLGNERWAVAKPWNSCPIGMLPSDLGSCGQLPVLKLDDGDEIAKPSKSNELRALKGGTSKRGSDCDVEVLNNSPGKRMRQTESNCELDGIDTPSLSLGSVRGHLMIGGLWKTVEQEELLGIASAVRILV